VITIIHVHQQVIASNRKHCMNKPPLTIKTYAGKSLRTTPISSRRAHAVSINGPSRVVHSPHSPLPCGARVWIETESEVICGEDDGGMEERQACEQVSGEDQCQEKRSSENQ